MGAEGAEQNGKGCEGNHAKWTGGDHCRTGHVAESEIKENRLVNQAIISWPQQS